MKPGTMTLYFATSNVADAHKESRSDVLLSTLRDYVHSLGGALSLIAEFPDRPPVVLAGLAAIENRKKRAGEASRKSRS